MSLYNQYRFEVKQSSQYETFAREYARVKMVKTYLVFVVPQGYFRWATTCE
ncbi:hypothetical protein [Thiomicrorhabdus sp. Milos-T2]|uniref:hypothetical protein n=1 Tax=Thiomicrorhabdus sp. Milos-T2 TaxID=90814 RepID=UPI000ADD0EA9|nr:hypothetical protein [Thiomicrorhabdus sp. Milos-T2]